MAIPGRSMNGDIVILSTNGNRKHECEVAGWEIEVVEEAERHSMWLHEAMHYFNFVVHVDAADVKPKEKRHKQTSRHLVGFRESEVLWMVPF